MCLRSSTLLLVIVIDGLRVTDNYPCATCQLPPLFLYRPLFGQAREYGKSSLGGQETPFISYFFARLRVFLEFSGGHRPQVGLFLPRDCGAFRPVLTSLFPLIRRSLIIHHLEMTAIEYMDTDVRSSELETGLSSSGESFDKDFEIVMLKPLSSSKPISSSKPSSSLSSILFHTLSESCFLEQRHLKSIRKRF
ncbi:hypothetical protein SO802_005193 [Lithocarpus litseifolius]|uniref:Uncharacterized protein n=1 Tax=Lithocarpus litseifolius TaxID=425828 RepID=A0AAW2DL93_9ROSI